VLKEPLSILHWKVANDSPVKLKLTLVVVVQAGDAAGPDVITGATGGVRSTSHTHEAGELVPVLDPDTPTASTWKVCDTADSPLYAFGLVQAANAAASSLHRNVALLAFVVNENDAVV
jgi:hypothetical protein